ncbi:MAG: CopD family protein [Myxococcota bacterium]
MSGTLIGLHVIGLILWMGGLFMLSRHVAVHTGIEGPKPDPVWKDWESKSYYIGVLPGFLITLGTGLYSLLANPALYLKADGPWGATFHAKLALVVVVIVLDQFFHFKMRKFHQTGEGGKGAFMAVHGVTALMFIGISLLVTGRYLA